MNLTTAMCWKLIARKVQTAIWIKQENPACLIINAENKAVEICDAVDDFQPSWKIPLRNCIHVTDQSYAQKLPPRPERLSVYSRNLRKIGIPFLSKGILLVVFGSSIHQALIQKQKLYLGGLFVDFLSVFLLNNNFDNLM